MLDIFTFLYNIVIQITRSNFDEEFLKLLNDYDIDILNLVFLQAHNYIFNKQKFKEELIRIFQHKFRIQLEKLYGSCIITYVTIYKACHIIPFCNSDYTNKYDIDNGLLMRNDLHDMFDKYIFSINPQTMQLEFDNNFFRNTSNKKTYEYLYGYVLTIDTNKKLLANLQQHYDIFIEKMNMQTEKN